MNKEDYPKPARDIGYDEMMTYVDNLVKQVAEYNPDQIIGIARSGMPFATFVAQKLDLDLGYYNPKYHHFMPAVEPKRIVFIDENFVSGGTQKDVHEFMAEYMPNVEYKLGVVMLDYFCPDKDCMSGTVLDFWANSMACFFKPIAIEERGVRFRDVTDCV
jgi:hypoxanthine phosphoribosyltransferase